MQNDAGGSARHTESPRFRSDDSDNDSGGDGERESGGRVGGGGSSRGDGESTNHRDALSNLGTSESYCEGLLSHLPGVGAERLPRRTKENLSNLYFILFPTGPLGSGSEGRGGTPGQSCAQPVFATLQGVWPCWPPTPGSLHV